MIKLYIGTALADIDQEISCEYSIADFASIEAGNLNTSYSIKFPLSTKNKSLFAFYSDLSVIEEPNRLASIYMDDILIMKGNLYITSIDSSSITGFISNDSWLANFSDKNLRDLVFTDALYTQALVTGTWTAAAGNLIRYPMVNYGKRAGLGDNWETTDFTPWINIGQIITQILSPYTIVSTFLNSAYFKTLYCRLQEPKPSQDGFIDGKALHCKPTSDTNSSWVITSNNFYVALVQEPVVLGTELYDEANAFSANQWTCQVAGTYRFRFYAHCQTNCFLGAYTSLTRSVSITKTPSSGTLGVNSGWTSTTTTPPVEWGQWVETEFIHCDVGDVVSASISLIGYSYYIGVSFSIYFSIYADSFLEIVPMTDDNLRMGLNYLQDYTLMLPDVPQIDFLIGIKHLFNLRFFCDEENKKVYIEPFASFIGTTVYDISDKVLPDTISVIPTSLDYKSKVRLLFAEDSEDFSLNQYEETNKTKLGSKAITMNSLYTETGVQDITNQAFSTFIKDLHTFSKPNVSLAKIYSDYSGVTYVNSAVILLTGTAGTCGIVIGGVKYLATFATSLAVTHNNWVTSFAASLLARNIKAISMGTGGIKLLSGYGYTIPEIVLIPGTTNLDGEVTMGAEVKAYIPISRITECGLKIATWDGMIAAASWTLNGVAKSTAPSISPLDLGDATFYSTYWSRLMHYIDKGKLVSFEMKNDPAIMAELNGVVNDATTEGFRKLYKFKTGNEYHLGILNRYVTNGEKAQIELLLVK